MRRSDYLYNVVYYEFYRLKKLVGLSQTECCILGTINSLCEFSKHKTCWLTNEQFADAFQITERQVQKCISKLRDVGLIEVNIRVGMFNRQTRQIDINNERLEELIGEAVMKIENERETEYMELVARKRKELDMMIKKQIEEDGVVLSNMR